MSDVEMKISEAEFAEIMSGISRLSGKASEREAFVVFQGGGAKGISHVGAVAALKDANIKAVGIAGTSAGAIVAALAAAKYTAEDLLASDGSGRHVLSTIDNLTSPTDLFGKDGWARLKLLRGFMGRKPDECEGRDKDEPASGPSASAEAPLPSSVSIAKGSMSPRKSNVLMKAVGAWLLRTWRQWLFAIITIALLDSAPALVRIFAPAETRLPAPWMWAVAAEVVIICFLVVQFRQIASVLLSTAGGLSPTSEIRRVIDKALVTELRKHCGLPPEQATWTWDSIEERGITFAEFVEAGGTPLRIVATDLTSQTARLFSAEDTPDVSVADAVCASAGLPVVFSIKSIDLPTGNSKTSRHFFLDGGLLSNLPLWVFDEDRSLNQSALTIGFTLEPAATESRDHGEEMKGLSWLSPALEAIVSGPKTIHHRAIEGLLLVSLPTGLDVLSFDQSNACYCAEVKKARAAAAAQLKFQMEFPAQLAVNLTALRDHARRELDRLSAGQTEMETLLRQYRGDDVSDSGDWGLSLSLLVQRPGYPRTLRVVASTDPEWGGRDSVRLVPFAWYRAVWRSEGGAYVIQVGSSDTLLNRSSAWQVALAVTTSGGQIDEDETALILVAESRHHIDFTSNKLSDEEEYELVGLTLYTIAQTLAGSIGALTLAFSRYMSSIDNGKNQMLEFDQHIRSAQLWQ